MSLVAAYNSEGEATSEEVRLSFIYATKCHPRTDCAVRGCSRDIPRPSFLGRVLLSCMRSVLSSLFPSSGPRAGTLPTFTDAVFLCLDCMARTQRRALVQAQCPYAWARVFYASMHAHGTQAQAL